mmetsp:Transcript_44708/g.111179  ORF Transcript_44708/g.111179 Transcript_44708/m.111179 type:complete len:222 (+) Transcript_44708:480-1145(+)
MRQAGASCGHPAAVALRALCRRGVPLVNQHRCAPPARTTLATPVGITIGPGTSGLAPPVGRPAHGPHHPRAHHPPSSRTISGTATSPPARLAADDPQLCRCGRARRAVTCASAGRGERGRRHSRGRGRDQQHGEQHHYRVDRQRHSGTRGNAQAGQRAVEQHQCVALPVARRAAAAQQPNTRRRQEGQVRPCRCAWEGCLSDVVVVSRVPVCCVCCRWWRG